MVVLITIVSIIGSVILISLIIYGFYCQYLQNKKNIIQAKKDTQQIKNLELDIYRIKLMIEKLEKEKDTENKNIQKNNQLEKAFKKDSTKLKK